MRPLRVSLGMRRVSGQSHDHERQLPRRGTALHICAPKMPDVRRSRVRLAQGTRNEL